MESDFELSYRFGGRRTLGREAGHLSHLFALGDRGGVVRTRAGDVLDRLPVFQQEHGGELDGILRYAHQDYLQTTLEWGILGFLLWALLIGGGIVRAIVYLRSYPRSLTRHHGMWIALCTLSLLGVLIHSLVDFPLQIASLQLWVAILLGQLWTQFAERSSMPMRMHPLTSSTPIANLSAGEAYQASFGWIVSSARFSRKHEWARDRKASSWRRDNF